MLISYKWLSGEQTIIRLGIDVKPSVNRSDVYVYVWSDSKIILLFPDYQRYKILVIVWAGWISD